MTLPLEQSHHRNHVGGRGLGPSNRCSLVGGVANFLLTARLRGEIKHEGDRKIELVSLIASREMRARGTGGGVGLASHRCRHTRRDG